MTDLRHRTLLVRSACLPQPDGDGSTRRLFHFVEFLRAAGCGVTCVAGGTRGADDSAEPLTDLGVRVLVGDDERVEALARAEAFDWALLGSWRIAESLGGRLRTAAPSTSIVVDAGDVHALRPAQRFPTGGGPRCAEERVRETVRAIDAYAAADAVLVASRREADLVADLIGDRRTTFAVPDSEDLAVSPFPFSRRRGVFLAGEFSHPHGFDALACLCDEILPHVDPALLLENPVYVAGGPVTDEIRALAADWPTVRMIGRVPSAFPYLERVRAVLAPLPRGADARRIMIQALSIGTPTITTSPGVECLALADERDVLVADDPLLFAAGITRLLTDEPLWNDLARTGREAIRAGHAHATARRRLLEALVACRRVDQAGSGPARTRRMSIHDYEAAIRHARDVIAECTPPGSVVAVVSRGDEEAVRLDGRTGWHFPLGDDGDYAGFHPATGREAVDHLEAVRERGAGFLAIPAPSAWWLDHYADLRTHLERHFRVIEADDGTCVLVSLREPPAGPQSLGAAAGEGLPVAGSSADERSPTIVFEGLSDRHTVTRSAAGSPPAISVVITTRNRATLLEEALDGLARQTAATATFEVVVVSDGSTDRTADVGRARADRLRLTLVESPPAGIAAARNLGVDAANAPLVLFLDDDVVAEPELVATHLAAHRRYPLEHVAAVGFTAWHERLPVTELMRFIADTDSRFLGSPLSRGRPLDHAAFRGGRASCKKSLLVRAGGFRPVFAFDGEDLEAGHRISRLLARERPRVSDFTTAVGLTVVPCRDAVERMARPITFAEFCAHGERHGRSRWMFSQCRADPQVDEMVGTRAAAARWQAIRIDLAARVARVHELERAVEAAGADHGELVRELRALYAWTLDAFVTKGFVEAAGSG